ncbi:MAG: hypothetical protein ACMUHY_00810, partial [Thermoplasmatota archaeon]
FNVQYVAGGLDGFAEIGLGIPGVARDTDVSEDEAEDLIITESNFSSIRNTDNSLYFQNCNDVTIQDSIFTEDSVTSAGAIYFNDQGSGHRFLRNYLNGVEYKDERFSTTGLIDNSTFIDSRVTIINGNTGGTIKENHFDNSEDYALFIQLSYRLTISKNYFHGIAGIYFDTIYWQTDTTPQIIDNNTFESCDVGINTGGTTFTRVTQTYISYNYFGNCTSYAINFNYGLINRIWRNIFYHNAGTDNTTAGAQVTEAYYPLEQYQNKWTVGTQGNFWANHRVPDNDNDGIVDVNYTLSGGGKDTRPFTNPYFDTTRPEVAITEPVSGDYPRPYARVKWTSSDIGSGVSEEFLSLDGGPWVEITGKTHHSLFLDQGFHDITVRAYDRAGLYNESKVQLTVPGSEEILILDKPLDGEFNRSGTQRISWTIRPYFVVKNITLEVDGITSYLPTNARILTKLFEEGQHTVKISVRDDDGLTFSRSATFTIDLTPPDILIRSPIPGSVISNTYVTINYTASDNYKVDLVEVRFDEGEFIDRTKTTQFSDLLAEGTHVMNIRAFDRAGWETNLTIPIQIGGDTGIEIIEPANGTVTKSTTVSVTWDYNGSFPWTNSYMRVGKGPLENIAGARSRDITILLDGRYDIIIRLEDDFGNYIEEITTIYRDTKAPVADFIYPKDGSIINDTSIEVMWAGRDQMDLSIREYLLSIDSGPLVSMGVATSTILDLDPGDHTLKIRALDLAGNTGEREIAFFIDVSMPVVRLLSPVNGSFIKDSSATIEWDAYDDQELGNLTLVIDHRLFIDVLGKSFHITTIGTDGIHSISLIAMDMAGNLVNVTIEIVVDLLPPALEWIDEPAGFIGRDWFNMSWTVFDENGLANLTLEWDDTIIYLDMDQQWLNLTLEEGNYLFTLRAVDKVGWEREISASSRIFVDLTPPQLDLDMGRSSVEGKRATIYWMAKDNGSGISETWIEIDGEGFSPVISGNYYIFENLKTGDHRITVRVIDNSGNSAEVYWDLIVGKDSGGDGDGSSGTMPTFVWIAIIMVGALLLVMVVGIVISRKRSRPPEKKMVSRPRRIDIAVPPAPSTGALPSSKLPSIDLPPATSGHVETTEEGSGYIRPKSEKRSRKKVIDMKEDAEPPPDIEVPIGGYADGNPPDEISTPGIEGTMEQVGMEPPSLDDEVPSIGTDGGSSDRLADKEITDEVPVWDEDEVPTWGEDEAEEPIEKDDDVQEWDDLDEMEELEELDEVGEWED